MHTVSHRKNTLNHKIIKVDAVFYNLYKQAGVSTLSSDSVCDSLADFLLHRNQEDFNRYTLSDGKFSLSSPQTKEATLYTYIYLVIITFCTNISDKHYTFC